MYTIWCQQHMENVCWYIFCCSILCTMVRCIFSLHLTISLLCFLLSTTYSDRPATKLWLITHHLWISDLQHCMVMTSYNCQIHQTEIYIFNYLLFMFFVFASTQFQWIIKCPLAFPCLFCQSSCACSAIVLDGINNPKVLYRNFSNVIHPKGTE